jgi:excisionase family DNA binding protein
VRTPATEAERHELRRNRMTVSEVAREIGYSRTQVYAFIKAGELTAWDGSRPGAKRKDYRIMRADFEKWYASRTINAGKSAA